jgi:hypothetical protein
MNLRVPQDELSNKKANLMMDVYERRNGKNGNGINRFHLLRCCKRAEYNGFHYDIRN